MRGASHQEQGCWHKGCHGLDPPEQPRFEKPAGWQSQRTAFEMRSPMPINALRHSEAMPQERRGTPWLHMDNRR
jgi:hypothetical protein